MTQMNDEFKHIKDMFWMRMITIGCLFLAAMSLLDVFIAMLYYLSYLTGNVNPQNDAALSAFIHQIGEAPFYYLTLQLYQLIMWSMVLFAALWLFRYYTWARRLLTTLLGVDMVITVILLLAETSTGNLKISEPEWYIFLNAFQVLLIIALSHPRMIAITETKTNERKADRLTQKLRQSLKEKGDSD